MAGLRNNNNTQNAQWADYVGDILRGAQPINQLVPQHPYLNDVPLIDELRHQNTHHVILLTLDVAKKYSALRDPLIISPKRNHV